MDATAKIRFEEALVASLAVCGELSASYQEPYQVWTRESKSTWSGANSFRPDLGRLGLDATNRTLGKCEEFVAAFTRAHPEYATTLVGCDSAGVMQLLHDPTWIVRCAIDEYWHRKQSLDYDASAVDQIVAEFAAFVHRDTVTVRIESDLVNFSCDAETFSTTSGVMFRRLSDEEIGERFQPGFKAIQMSSRCGHSEWVLRIDLEEQKRFGSDAPKMPRAVDLACEKFDQVVTALRAFQSGPVGFDSTAISFVGFCPMSGSRQGYATRYVPWGSYKLALDEFDRFKAHLDRISQVSKGALLVALDRLVDAEGRIKPRDMILDAVAGLEAILIGNDSELSYRFALRYSTLFDTDDDRYRAFRVARHLYKYRSKIAHGESLDPERGYDLGDESLKLHEIAKRSKTALRRAINHFLPSYPDAPYKKDEFWDTRLFRIQ